MYQVESNFINSNNFKKPHQISLGLKSTIIDYILIILEV